MKLVNKTHWRTDQLRRLINRVAEDELDAPDRKRLQVTVTYGRAGDDQSSGWCPIVGGGRMAVRIGRLALNRPAIALVLAHEMAHCRGLGHPQMRGSRYNWQSGWRERYEWAAAAEFLIERNPPKAKRAVDVQEVRYGRVLVQQKAWATKLKRAQTALKKLAAKKRYYEKAIAAKREVGNEDGR